MSEPRNIVLDTETTGIGPEFHRLLEIAALEFIPSTGGILTPYHVVINPQRDVPDEAAAVHGWTTEKLLDKPLLAEVADEFLAFVEGAHVVIHNARFDVGFLDTELDRIGKPKLSTVAASITCTLVEARTWMRDLPRHTLDVLCTHFNIDRSKRVLHGALIDCELLAAVYVPLMAECNRRRGLLNAILPRPYGAPLPATLAEAAEAHLDLHDIIALLTKEQKRYTEQTKKMSAGLPQTGDTYTVEFKDGTATDWKKVTKALLQGVDLKPYQKGKSSMSIKRPKAPGAVDEDDESTEEA
jgi:DNA polymerase-3 subunit epsilon